MEPSSGPPTKPSNLSGSLHSRLNMYAVAATAAGVGVLAAASPAEARIIYTKAHRLIGPSSRYNLDLNHDGRTDFTLTNTTRSTDRISLVYLRLWSAKGNSAIDRTSAGWAFASALKQGSHIGPRRVFHAWSPFLVSGTSGNIVGPWDDVTNRYLGLRLQIHGRPHYGWARMTVRVSGGGITATLTGYAYETIPNKPIIAGKGHDPYDGTTKPATLGRLALGRK